VNEVHLAGHTFTLRVKGQPADRDLRGKRLLSLCVFDESSFSSYCRSLLTTSSERFGIITSAKEDM